MIKSKFVSFLSSYRCLAFLIGIAFGMVPAMTASANSPALVVIIVIDGLPQEQLVKYRDLYGPGGFRLLLEDGAWYGNAHHGHAVTLTAPGHASVLTGTYPYRNGIIANEWREAVAAWRAPPPVQPRRFC